MISATLYISTLASKVVLILTRLQPGVTFGEQRGTVLTVFRDLVEKTVLHTRLKPGENENDFRARALISAQPETKESWPSSCSVRSGS